MARKPKPIKERTKKVRQFMGQGRRTKVHESALVFDDVLAQTVEGFVVHVPTGRNVCLACVGAPEAEDDRKFILHMLEADREGWRLSRIIGWGEELPGELSERLKATVRTYPGG